MSTTQNARLFLTEFHLTRGFGGLTPDSVASCMIDFLNAHGSPTGNDEALKKIKEEFEEFKKANDLLAIKFDEAEKKIALLETENKELETVKIELIAEIKALRSKKKSEPPKTE